MRILLLDDEASFRDALAFILERQAGFRVVAEVGSLKEALSNGAEWDVAVVDLGLPDGDAAVAIEALRRRRPGASILVLTASARPLELARAVEAGAVGFAHKTSSMPEILGTIRRAADGETLLDAAEVLELVRVAREERDRLERRRELANRLTRREHEVLQALADGHNSREIAAMLHITVETLRTHTVNILSKLDVHSQLQAVVAGVRHGIVEVR